MKRLIVLVVAVAMIAAGMVWSQEEIVRGYECHEDIKFPGFTYGTWETWSLLGEHILLEVSEDGLVAWSREGDLFVIGHGDECQGRYDERVVTFQEDDTFRITWAADVDENGEIYHEPNNCGHHRCTLSFVRWAELTLEVYESFEINKTSRRFSKVTYDLDGWMDRNGR